MKVAIVVDSTTKLREDFSSHVDIYTIPVRVFIDDEEFQDTDEIADKILSALNEGKKLETSLPKVDYVENLFEKLHRQYDVIYVLSVSSILSGTYSLLSTIANKYENIVVFDSKTVSIQNTYILERMVKDISNGKNIDEDDIIYYRDDSLFLISIFDISRLHKSGRVGKIISLIGKMIHVKPIITIARSGEVQLVQKAISAKKIAEILEEKVDNFIEKVKTKNPGNIKIYAAVGKEEYKEYVYKISKKYDVKPYFLEIGPGVLTHVGTEGFGILIGFER